MQRLADLQVELQIKELEDQLKARTAVEVPPAAIPSAPAAASTPLEPVPLLGNYAVAGGHFSNAGQFMPSLPMHAGALVAPQLQAEPQVTMSLQQARMLSAAFGGYGQTPGHAAPRNLSLEEFAQWQWRR